MLVQGSATPKILIVSDFQRVHCKAEGAVLSQWLGEPLFNALKRAGIKADDWAICCLHDCYGDRKYGAPGAVSDESWTADMASFGQWLQSAGAGVNVVVPLGEHALAAVTGLKGIGKWHCSVVPSKAEYGGRKCLPLLHPDHVSRVWSDHVYLNAGCSKLSLEAGFPDFRIPKRNFLLSPPFKQTMEYLYDVVLKAPEVAIDWEFGRGQLNTLGFAVSPEEAIAIRALPGEYTPEQYYELFEAVRQIAEGQSAKIVQHSMIETEWLARYGIELRNVKHDTMWAMKFLHPELEKGLANVGRLYTSFPYWKDDNDDWNNIKDWRQHLEYNCKDTTGTFAAYLAQVTALRARGLDTLFYSFVMQFQPVIQEMCITGLRVDAAALHGVREGLLREQDNFLRIIEETSQGALQASTNSRSPKQVQTLLKALGMKLPTKKVKGKDNAQQTTDKKALVKLKRQYPDASVLPALIGISAANKRLSSYVDFEYDRSSERVHYTLDGCATEPGRWAGYNTSWGEGFNPQTVPKAIRRCFTADPGCVLVEVDLKSADSWCVALEAPEPKLIELLKSGADIHRYVAGKIFNKPPEIVSEFERQLGKKAGHAANYGTGPRTFAETCLVEMNHYLEEREAKRVLEAYFEVFPGIRRRQEAIKRTIYNTRKLTTPFGRERHFYGRADDSTFREAYAYSPPSTVSDIVNTLMLSLWRDRDAVGLAWDDGGRFLLQVHDSLLLQTTPERVPELAEYCRSLDWHPHIELPGGVLRIPVDVKQGLNWRSMESA